MPCVTVSLSPGCFAMVGPISSVSNLPWEEQVAVTFILVLPWEISVTPQEWEGGLS